jgi:hypothetical protein
LNHADLLRGRLRTDAGEFDRFARYAIAMLPLTGKEPVVARKFIDKTIGWILREVGRKRPALVREFLEAHVDPRRSSRCRQRSERASWPRDRSPSSRGEVVASGPAMTARRPSVLVLLASTLAAMSACKSKSAQDESESTAGKTEAGAGDSKGPADTGGDPSEPVEPGIELDDPRALALPIPQAKTALTVKAKGSKSLPSSLSKIQHLYALSAAAKQPEWGAIGVGEAKLSRDDDLDTAWVCNHGQATSCVLGFALPEPAKIEIVRIYGASGPRFRDYTGHPRLAKVRIHTDAGFVDVELPDGANHAYVLFDAPVDTQTLAIELLDVHKGKTDSAAHFAEVEIYGTEGVPRAPIVLDPSQGFVSWETTAWDDGKSGKHTVRQTFVEFLRPESEVGKPPLTRRFMRATGVYGKAGDDYLLFERLFSTDCTETEGSYLLFDRRNRMFYPLVDLGGAGAPVYRHSEGRGFAAGWIDGDRFTVKGVVEEAGELKWKRPPKQLPEDPLAQLAEWGFETTPISRGGSLTDVTPGCSKPTSADLDGMAKAAKLPMGGEFDPAQWLECGAGNDTLFVNAACDAPAQAYLVGLANALTGKYASKDADSRGFRIRRIDDARGTAMLLELSGDKGDSGIVYFVDTGVWHQLEKAGGLFVRPPSTCAPCKDEWGASPDAELDETGESGAEDETLDGSFADEDVFGAEEEFADEEEFAEGFPDEGFADEEMGDEGIEGEGEAEEEGGEEPARKPPPPKPPAPVPPAP